MSSSRSVSSSRPISNGFAQLPAPARQPASLPLGASQPIDIPEPLFHRVVSSSFTILLETPSPGRMPSTEPTAPPPTENPLSQSAPESNLSLGSPPKTSKRFSWTKLLPHPLGSKQSLVPTLPLGTIAEHTTTPSTLDSPPSLTPQTPPAKGRHKSPSTKHPRRSTPSSDESRKSSTFLGSMLQLTTSPRSRHAAQTQSAPTSPTASEQAAAHLHRLEKKPSPIRGSFSQDSIQHSSHSSEEILPSPITTESDKRMLNFISNYSEEHPGGEVVLAQFVSSFMKSIPSPERNRLYYQLFLGEKYTTFLTLLFKHSDANLTQTAQKILEIAHSAHLSEEEIINRVAAHTREDLKKQTEDTFFRAANFSACLCINYGMQHDRHTLETFYDFLINHLQVMKNTQDCFGLMDSSFTSPFNQIDPNHTIKRNVQVGLFEAFATTALCEFYKLKFSPQFRRVLAVRRGIIEEFFEQKLSSTASSSTSSNPSPHDLSRKFIGEIPFLRMGCPALATLSKDPQYLPFLITFSKLLIQMTNEVKFSSPNEDPLIISLNLLFQSSLSDHKEFLEECSTYP